MDVSGGFGGEDSGAVRVFFFGGGSRIDAPARKAHAGERRMKHYFRSVPSLLNQLCGRPKPKMMPSTMAPATLTVSMP